jgi:hypothetical protein
MGWLTMELGLIPCSGRDVCLHCHQTASWTHPTNQSNRYLKLFPLRVKRLGSEARHSLHLVLRLKMSGTEQLSSSSNDSDSYSGSHWFESWPGHQLFWMRFLVTLLSPSRQVPGWHFKSSHNHFLPHPKSVFMKQSYICAVYFITLFVSGLCSIRW